MTRPPRMPPPPRATVKAGPQWSRPALLLMRGVRPNSPVTTTSVLPSMPRSARSRNSAANAESSGGSRALQKIIKVAYLGPEYSYSHLAAVERFGSAIEYIRVGSIMSVFEEVNRSHVDYGVVPLENSTDGGVSDTLDMFMRLPHLKICAEVRLRIHHNLLANCDQEQIRRVYSKPQALAQCRNWLSKNLPHADLKDVSSTAVAAQLAQQEPGAAAVASRQAAVKYGLRMLFNEIDDHPHNETRFAVIGHQEAAKSGSDKTALMFKVPHHPGSLIQALDVFKSNK